LIHRARRLYRGDGTLSPNLPGNQPSDMYLYNPMRPVPTIGGQVVLPGSNAAGPRDYGEVELRDDVLVIVLLNLWATANVFLPCHRIRLEVSSSNFPRFARNSNRWKERKNP